MLHYICVMGNIRKTKLVNIILDTFGDTNIALSVVELVKKFQKDMNKTTVYRILDRLEQKSILYSFSGVNGLKWYAKSQNPNQANDINNHFHCQKCGKLESLTIDFNIPQLSNHKINSANLIITGQCGNCPS